jgi:hypothetical protein
LTAAYVTGVQAGQQDTETFLRRWKDIFDYGYEEIAAAWEDDDEDRRLMELPDVRGVEPPPPGSGWA